MRYEFIYIGIMGRWEIENAMGRRIIQNSEDDLYELCFRDAKEIYRVSAINLLKELEKLKHLGSFGVIRGPVAKHSQQVTEVN